MTKKVASDNWGELAGLNPYSCAPDGWKGYTKSIGSNMCISDDKINGFYKQTCLIILFGLAVVLR